MNEFELIHWIKANAPVYDDSYGIGDDAAVIFCHHQDQLVMTTDSLVEDIHFSRQSFSPEDVGYKALAVNISDIAAMGATPKHALISLGVPDDVSGEWMQQFYAGIFELCREYQISVIGGNMSRSLGGFWVSVTLTGRPIKKTFKRSLALDGDVLCVSGLLGRAALGLEFLRKKPDLKNDYTQCQRRPRARVDVAQLLSEFDGVHAVMDMSDGLSIDLKHMMLASQKNAVIDLSPLMDDELIAHCNQCGIDAESLILHGGEDYELLISVSKNDFSALELAAKDRIKLIPIGFVVAGHGDVYSKNISGDLNLVIPKGFRHF